MKSYIVNEQDLKELVWASEMINLIEISLPTGLEGFEEVVEIDDIDVTDFQEFKGE